MVSVVVKEPTTISAHTPFSPAQLSVKTLALFSRTQPLLLSPSLPSLPSSFPAPLCVYLLLFVLTVF